MSAYATRLINNPSFNNTMQPLVYLIKPGDSVSKIIHNYYGISISSPRYKAVEQQLVRLNPSITSPDRIVAGKTLLLYPEDYGHMVGQCTLEDAMAADRSADLSRIYAPMLQRYQNNLPTAAAEQEAFWAMSWLQENYDYLNLSAGSGLGTLGAMTTEGHNLLIKQVDIDYQAYKNGQITKGQYDYRRQKTLKLYAQKVGPLEQVLMKGKTAREAIRINRSRALPASANIDRHLGHLNKVAKVAAHGGPILTIAGGAMGCYSIANANTTQEKNEIFVETVSGAAIGTAVSIGLGIFLASNPVGWVIGLGLAVGATGVGYGVGKLARSRYSSHYSEYDLVGDSFIGNVCK